jgi:phosphate transport system permease protein
MLFTIPLGIGAAVFLEEYMKKRWYSSWIEVCLSNLAGIPSIIYGLLALGLLVYQLGLGQSILTAGLTLSMLVLPIVIVATRESLRSIPSSLREAAYALGASKLQVLRHHLLPYSQAGIFTGVILSLSRALGETAPLITIGALTFIAFLPSPPFTSEFPYLSFTWLSDPFTVLPIQLFNWTSRPQVEFHKNAAAASLILLSLTLILNLGAILLRNRARKKYTW